GGTLPRREIGQKDFEHVPGFVEPGRWELGPHLVAFRRGRRIEVRIETRAREAVKATDRPRAGRRIAGVEALERETGTLPTRELAGIELPDFDRIGGDEVVVERRVVVLDDVDQ